MSKRHSILRPLTTKEQEQLIFLMCELFSPMRYDENCTALGIERNPKGIIPFSLADLLKFIKIKTGIEAHSYKKHIEIILQRLVSNAIFIFTGYELNGSPPYNQCYYAIIELTNRQKKNLFWLGCIFGEEYLLEKYRKLIVRFEGENKNGESGTGSGILINKNTILTCAHNLIDLTAYRCFIDETEILTNGHKVHSKHDIGLVTLKSEIDMGPTPYFGTPYVLENTLTLGYPPLRGMREAPLIAQKGEINALSKDWNNCDCITISSTVRPGNSGGPVISKNGYIVGIVTQYANSAASASVNKNDFKDNHSIPFYNAIASTGIVDILRELDETLEILFEDYE